MVSDLGKQAFAMPLRRVRRFRLTVLPARQGSAVTVGHRYVNVGASSVRTVSMCARTAVQLAVQTATRLSQRASYAGASNVTSVGQYVQHVAVQFVPIIQNRVVKLARRRVSPVGKNVQTAVSSMPMQISSNVGSTRTSIVRRMPERAIVVRTRSVPTISQHVPIVVKRSVPITA